MTVALHHKVYLAMLWGIVVLGLESVRDELLGDEVFEDGSEVDVRFAVLGCYESINTGRIAKVG